jgi:hypothetical protein
MSLRAGIVLGVCLLVTGAIFLGASQQSKVDVTGDWEMAMVGGPGGPGGSQAPAGPPPGRGGGNKPDRPKMVMTFVQKGEVLAVKMQNPMGDEMTGTGKIVGNEIEFTFTMTGGPMGDMTIVHKGKVDGDTMKGTMTMGDMGEREWSAKRVVKK